MSSRFTESFKSLGSVAFFLLIAGCGGEEETTSTTTTTTTSVTTTTTTQATTETSTNTTPTGTTTTGPNWEGWQVVDSTSDGFELYDYVLETWEVGPEAEDYFQSNLETDRRFFLLRPNTPKTEEIPLLVNFHGGVVDDDSDKNYYNTEDIFLTKCGLAQEVSAGFTRYGQLQSHEVMERGWAMVVPVNLWCDFWVGRGEDDPVDPVHHKSYVHVSQTIDFLRDSGAGFGVSNLYLWGSSSGGAGVMPIAHWYGGVNGVVSDSPPCNMVEYFQDDQSSLMHMYGGPPYEMGGEKSPYYQNYLDVSCNWLVEEGGYNVPTYLAYNQRDLLTGAYSPESMVAAMETVWAKKGIRYGYHDFDHNSPGSTFHTQTRSPETIAQYTTRAMFSFLEGATITWREAEDGCTTWPCEVGVVEDGDKIFDSVLMNSSNSKALTVRPGDGEGIWYVGRVPAEYGVGSTVTAVFVMEGRATEGTIPTTKMFDIEYVENTGLQASKVVYYSDMVADQISDDPTDEEVFAEMQQQMLQYNATSLTFTVNDPANARLIIKYSGAGTASAKFYLDAILFEQW